MEQNQTIGALLKSVREKKNVALEDIANKTKININVLRSLERDDIEALPNRTYVKGFVKNYAKTLGINIDEALSALDNAYREAEPQAPQETEELQSARSQAEKAPPKHEDAASISSNKRLERVDMRERVQGILSQLINKKILVGLVVLVAGVFIIKALTGFFTSITTESDSFANKADIEAGAEGAEEGIKSSDSSLFELENAKKLGEEDPNEEASPAADASSEEAQEKNAEANSDAPMKAEPAKIEAKKEDAKEPEKAAKTLPPGKVPYEDFYPAPRNLFSLNADAPEVKNEEILPKKYKDAVEPEKHNLFINALEGDTWLSYQLDDEDIKRFVLKKGKSLFIQADEVILIFMGNLNVTKMFYNNQLVDAPTRTGVKSLIFPESQAGEYDLPLFPTHNGVPYKQDVYKKRMVDKPAE